LKRPGITDAVVPAAGLGTRMRALTGGKPKELLTVGGKPLIFHALQEALDAGVTRIILITTPRKPALREYLADRVRFIVHAERVTFTGLARAGIETVIIKQPEPLGAAHAVSLAEPALGGRDFLVLLPDNFCPEQPSPARQLAAAHTPGRCCAGIVAPAPGLRLRNSSSSSVAYEATHDKNSVLITGLFPRKSAISPAAAAAPPFRTTGRSVYSRDFFTAYRETRFHNTHERDNTPVLQRLAAERKLDGCILSGACFDAGIPEGYAAARRWAASHAR